MGVGIDTSHGISLSISLAVEMIKGSEVTAAVAAPLGEGDIS